jgi:hypothetical protein
MTTARFERAFENPSLWLAGFILISCIIGFNTFRDFGVSYDEPGIYHFAPVAIDMYSGAFNPPARPVYLREAFLRESGIPSNLFNYGPFYFMAVELLVRGIHALGGQTPYWDLWHLAYFLTYEAGIAIFYLLCRRWLSGWASLGATVLFATQPLIVGHAFINPKDLPFMVFFMASIYSGLMMADQVAGQEETPAPRTLKDLPDLINAERLAISPEKLTAYRNRIFLLVGAMLVVVLWHPIWETILQRTVQAMHAAPGTSIAGSILRIFSNDPQNIPVEKFVAKGQVWLGRAEALMILTILGGIFWITHRLLPNSGRLVGRFFRPPFERLLRSLITPWVLVAGVVLGLTMSIRILAPLAGGLVLVYMLWKTGRRAFYPATIYLCVACAAMYLTWPYLWGEPVGHLLKSWRVMNAFSDPGPWYSLPRLLATQYTETAILLSLAGMALIAVEFIRGKRSGLFFLFLGWTVLPLGYLVLKRSLMYDNFRQVLFTIPPFFMIAGLAIEKIVDFLRRPSLILLFIVLIALPGLWSVIQLHPYEYVYYNHFVSDRKSNFREFNGDYWGTSQKEIVEYLNATVPKNTTVQVCSTYPITFPTYIRPDISIKYDCETMPKAEAFAHYVVITSLKSLDTIPYPQSDVVYSVGRDGSIFAAVLLVSQTK